MIRLEAKIHDDSIMICCTDCQEPWFIPIENMHEAQGVRETINYQSWFETHMLRRHGIYTVYSAN